jgi:hypothetical protein
MSRWKLNTSCLILFFLCQGCAQEKQSPDKINGITFVATRNPIDSTDVKPIQADYAANYAAVIPYGFMRSLNDPEIYFNTDRQWWGERVDGARKTIILFQEENIKVMLKPQIWIGGGDYTGSISMLTNAKWKQLEESYTDFILTYARLAAETNTDIFCIGTEMDSFVAEQPAYWAKLIEQINAIYKGKLTYAGNWDTYDQVHFWDKLDYIGVDAYFPVSGEKTPTLTTLNTSWKKWKNEMSSLSRKHNKQILLTEYGYVSADYAGKEPWKNAGDERAVNIKAQENLLKGLYQNLWQEKWLAGGFLWKHHAETGWRGYEKLFTTQDKPAQAVVRANYSKAGN